MLTYPTPKCPPQTVCNERDTPQVVAECRSLRLSEHCAPTITRSQTLPQKDLLAGPTKSARACLLLRARSLFHSRTSCAHLEAPLEPARARPRSWARLVREWRRSTMYPRLRAPFLLLLLKACRSGPDHNAGGKLPDDTWWLYAPRITHCRNKSQQPPGCPFQGPKVQKFRNILRA